MSSKPIIGITGYQIVPEEGVGGQVRGRPGQGFDLLGQDYVNSVRGAGGIPVGIPVLVSATQNDVAELVRGLDGFVLSGGEDLDPKRYGEQLDARVGTIRPERDEFELRLLEEVLRQRKPLLCICRGIQLLNVYFGGTLYLDNEDHAARSNGKVLAHHLTGPTRWYLSHAVKLMDERLIQLYGRDVIEVNTYHHQSVRDVGAGLIVGAIAPDGIVESLYYPEYPKLLAVQWHPEMMSPALDEGLIPFRWLITQCGSD